MRWKKIFVSGSRTDNYDHQIVLEEKVKELLDLWIDLNCEFLVWDAKGVDTEVLKYLVHKWAKNQLSLYYIGNEPRYESYSVVAVRVDVDVSIKDEREKQEKKDEVMTKEADISFVVWNGWSRGAYNNIKRAFAKHQPLCVFYEGKIYWNNFESEKVDASLTLADVERIYEENHWFSISEYEKFYNKKISQDKKSILNRMYENQEDRELVNEKTGRFGKVKVFKKMLLDKYASATKISQGTLF